MPNFINVEKAIRISNAVAAGTTTVNATHVDTTGFQSVTFVITFGTITSGAVTSIKAQGGALANDSDMADLTGTNMAVADTNSNKFFLLEVDTPMQQYVRPVVVRGTQNAVIDSILAVLRRPRNAPVTQDATVGGALLVLSPAPGTP